MQQRSVASSSLSSFSSLDDFHQAHRAVREGHTQSKTGVSPSVGHPFHVEDSREWRGAFSSSVVAAAAAAAAADAAQGGQLSSACVEQMDPSPSLVPLGDELVRGHGEEERARRRGGGRAAEKGGGVGVKRQRRR